MKKAGVVMMCPPRFRVKSLAKRQKEYGPWGRARSRGAVVAEMSNLEKGEGQKGRQAGCP